MQEECPKTNMKPEERKREDKSSSEVARSCSSSKSSVVSAAAKARALAEAAWVNMPFTKKQLEMKKEMVRLDLERVTLEANLEVLD